MALWNGPLLRAVPLSNQPDVNGDKNSLREGETLRTACRKQPQDCPLAFTSGPATVSVISIPILPNGPCLRRSSNCALFQAVRITLELKKHLVDMNMLDVTQVGRIILASAPVCGLTLCHNVAMLWRCCLHAAIVWDMFKPPCCYSSILGGPASRKKTPLQNLRPRRFCNSTSHLTNWPAETGHCISYCRHCIHQGLLNAAVFTVETGTNGADLVQNYGEQRFWCTLYRALSNGKPVFPREATSPYTALWSSLHR